MITALDRQGLPDNWLPTPMLPGGRHNRPARPSEKRLRHLLRDYQLRRLREDARSARSHDSLLSDLPPAGGE